MTAVYECRCCHVVHTEPAELCLPAGVDIRCDYGPAARDNLLKLCPPMRARVAYACDLCGRPTLAPELACVKVALKKKR